MADKDPNEGVPQQQEISILNEGIHMRVEGQGEDEVIHISKTQPDGTMRSWSLHVGIDPDGVERAIRVDDEGTFIHVPLVTDERGNKLPISGTDEGVLRVNVDGVKKTVELELLQGILNELRLHRMFFKEMTDEELDISDLGVAELEAR